MNDDRNLNGMIDPVVSEAEERFTLVSSWESDARTRFMDDDKFYNGDVYNGYQWPNQLRVNRDIEEKPCLTINKVRQHCLQIINDAKRNKPGIQVRATGGGATYQSAQLLGALIRHIEYVSKASVAYGTATEFQVKGGKGWLRVSTDYVDTESFNQQILIERVKDPLSVYIDRDAKEADKSDARYCIVIDVLAKDEAKKKYPKFADKLGNTPLRSGSPFLRENQVCIAEYFRKVEDKDTLYAIVGANGPQYMRKSMLKSLLEAQGQDTKEYFAGLENDPAVRSRPIDDEKIEYYLIIGQEIAERKIWPGKYIPFVPVVGEETIIEGQYDCKGHVRSMIDPQRMYNYWSPLALDTPLPTPSGWTTMGQAKRGDWLLDENGRSVQVAGVSPIHLHRKCFRVEFDNGSSIVADAEHKWTVEERGKRIAGGFEWSNRIVSTQELAPKKHFIWVTKPVELPEAELPIHPYLLGVWLGDGTTAAPRITCGHMDVEEMRRNLEDLGLEVTVQFQQGKTAATLGVHGVVEKFRSLGLLGNKHIPEMYLRASKEQRLDLLRGLMDTDGAFAERTNQCDFTTTSDAIAAGFAELLTSLGLKSTSCVRKAVARTFPSGETYDCQAAHQFYFSAPPKMEIFKLCRKSSKQTRDRKVHPRRTGRHRIIAVKEVPSVPVKCVSIDSKSHLFLAGEGMIPTHNSAAVEYGALQGKTPWMAAVESIEGFETYYTTANRINHAWLPYKAFDKNGQKLDPPTRTQPPVAAPVAVEGMRIAQAEFGLASGQYENTMGQQSNERSAQAMFEHEKRGDNATFHFLDNQAIAIRQIGVIVLDLIPRIMDTQQVMQIINLEEQPIELIIDPQAQQAAQVKKDAEGKAIAYILNPAVGKYEVQADVGPGFATRREEAFEAFKLILTQNPTLTGVLGDILFRAGDFPHADEAAQRLRRMVPAYALGEGPSPTEQQLQGQVQQLMQLLTQNMEELSALKLRSKGQEQKRDIGVYDAFTKRLQVLLKSKIDAVKAGVDVAQAAQGAPGGETTAAVPGVEQSEIETIINDLMPDLLGVDLTPIIEANAQAHEAAGGDLPQLQPQLDDPSNIRRDFANRPFGRDFANSRAFRPI